MLDVYVSIIIPGYNEGTHIFDNLLEIDCFAKKTFRDYEIIFVNDGSTDDTQNKSELAALESSKIRILKCRKNYGKGYALRLGTEVIKGQYTVFIDADLELHPSQLPRFFKIMVTENADAVIGSKSHPESQLNYPFGRRFLSSIYNKLINILFHLNLHDTQTGLKLFKSEVIQPAMKKTTVNRFAYEIEILSLLNQMGAVIKECPIILKYNRINRWGRIRIGDIIQVFFDTLLIFYRIHFTKFYE